MSSRGGSVAGLGKQRVESLTDGIFGTVMTVLGLTLVVPWVSQGVSFGSAGPDLRPLVPELLSYGLSFVILGVFWVGHHVAFHYIRRTDRTLIWLNNVFLLFVGILPLATVLLGDYPLARETLALYGLNLIAIGLMLYATFWYATVHHHLVDEDLDAALIRNGRRRILLGPSLSAVAIVLAFFEPLASLAAYVLFPVLFILPGRIDAFWRRQELP